jgi:hypothetical protein
MHLNLCVFFALFFFVLKGNNSSAQPPYELIIPAAERPVNLPDNKYKLTVRMSNSRNYLLETFTGLLDETRVVIPENGAVLVKIMFNGRIVPPRYQPFYFHKGSKKIQTAAQPDLRRLFVFVEIEDKSNSFSTATDSLSFMLQCEENSHIFETPPIHYDVSSDKSKISAIFNLGYEDAALTADCKKFVLKSLGRYNVEETKNTTSASKLSIHSIISLSNNPHKVMNLILLDTNGVQFSDANIYLNFKVDVNNRLLPVEKNLLGSSPLYTFRDISNGKGKYKFINSSGILFDTANAQIDAGAQSITIKQVKSISPFNPSGGPDMQIGIRLTQILKAAAYNDQNTTYALLQQLPHSPNFEIPVPEIGKGCKYYGEIKNPLKKGVLILFGNIDRYGNDYGYDVQMIQDITWIIPNESFYFIYESSYAPKRHKERGYRVQKKVYGTYNANSGQTYLENCEIIPSSIKCNKR